MTCLGARPCAKPMSALNGSKTRLRGDKERDEGAAQCLQVFIKHNILVSSQEREGPTMAKGAMKLGELGAFIREQRRAARLSLRKMSDLAGISNPYLSQIERGLRKPSAEILQAIAKALRISAETLYVRAGILEEDREHDLVDDILRSPSLTERQKQALIDHYRSYVESAREPHEKAASVESLSRRDTASDEADRPSLTEARVEGSESSMRKRRRR